jgi:hypothetical protein
MIQFLFLVAEVATNPNEGYLRSGEVFMNVGHVLNAATGNQEIQVVQTGTREDNPNRFLVSWASRVRDQLKNLFAQ